MGAPYAGRQVIDGIVYVSDVISGICAKPAKAVGSKVADIIAPQYWVPNAEASVSTGSLMNKLV